MKDERTASEYKQESAEHKPAALCHLCHSQPGTSEAQGKKDTDLSDDPEYIMLIFPAHAGCQRQPYGDQQKKCSVIYQCEI